MQYNDNAFTGVFLLSLHGNAVFTIVDDNHRGQSRCCVVQSVFGTEIHVPTKCVLAIADMEMA